MGAGISAAKQKAIKRKEVNHKERTDFVDLNVILDEKKKPKDGKELSYYPFKISQLFLTLL